MLAATDIVRSPDIWAFLHNRLLPEGGRWFSFLTDLTHMAGAP